MTNKPNTGLSLGLHTLILLALIVNLGLIFSMRYGSNAVLSQDFGELKVVFLTTPDCESCFTLDPFKDYFEERGIAEDQFVEHAYDSRKGKKLVKKYEISKVPSVVVEGDVNAHEFLNELIDIVGVMRNNAFVVDKAQPPYYDLDEDKVRGEFEAIFLADATCEECYDVALHDQVFERLGLIPSKSTNLDIADEEGKLLIEEYVIPAVPTVLLRGDLEVYESLKDIWDQVGTVEEDGTYVLRKGVASMGIYKELPDGDIINPQAEVGDEELE